MHYNNRGFNNISGLIDILGCFFGSGACEPVPKNLLAELSGQSDDAAKCIPSDNQSRLLMLRFCLWHFQKTNTARHSDNTPNINFAAKLWHIECHLGRRGRGLKFPFGNFQRALSKNIIRVRIFFRAHPQP
jgi:hypothetical protein